VVDPENILHKRKEKESDSDIFINNNLSFPKEAVKRIDDLELGIKFEQNLFRSKS